MFICGKDLRDCGKDFVASNDWGKVTTNRDITTRPSNGLGAVSLWSGVPVSLLTAPLAFRWLLGFRCSLAGLRGRCFPWCLLLVTSPACTLLLPLPRTPSTHPPLTLRTPSTHPPHTRHTSSTHPRLTPSTHPCLAHPRHTHLSLAPFTRRCMI